MKRMRSVPLAIGIGIVATILLLLAAGAPPLEAMQVIFDGAFGNTSRISATLMAWVPLVLAAAGLLITFQAGVWNIGVEGQIVMGAIGAAWVARSVPGPSMVVIPLTLVGGAALGAAWALLPAWLRTRFRVHEIFSGVALSFVAASVAVYLIIGPWSRAGIASTSGTDLFGERTWLPEVGSWRVSPLAIVLAVAAVVAVLILLRDSRFGLRLRAVGRNPQSSFLLGIPTGRYTVAAFGLCGALAGLAGTVQATGFHHKLVPAVSGGYGFPCGPRRSVGELPGSVDRSDRPLLRRGPGGKHTALAATRYRLIAGGGSPGSTCARGHDRGRRSGVLGGAVPWSPAGRRLTWRSSLESSQHRLP